MLFYAYMIQCRKKYLALQQTFCMLPMDWAICNHEPQSSAWQKHWTQPSCKHMGFSFGRLFLSKVFLLKLRSSFLLTWYSGKLGCVHMLNKSLLDWCPFSILRKSGLAWLTSIQLNCLPQNTMPTSTKSVSLNSTPI